MIAVQTLTRFNRWFLVHVARSHYWCRCGAFVPGYNRALHEQFHDAAREFFQPPTGEQLDYIRSRIKATR